MAKLTIDEFVIALGFDTSNLTKGQREAINSFKRTQEGARASAQQMEKDGDKAASFFGKIKGEALALGAVLIGANGLKDFVAKSVSGLVQLGVVSGNIGLAAREVSAFQMVMARNGDSADAALATLQKIAQIQQGYRTGVMPETSYLQGLGFIGGTAKDNPIEIFEKFAKWSEGQKDRQRVSQIGGWLGFDDAQIAQAAKGLQNFQEQMKQSRENAPDEQDIKNAQELNAAFKELSQTMQSLARGPLITLLHELVGFLKDIDRLGHEGKKNATGNPFLDTWNTVTGRHDGARQAPPAQGGRLHAPSAADIIAFNHGLTATMGGGGGNPSQADVLHYLSSGGLSPSAARGVTAGIWAETGGNFGAVNTAGGGRGARGAGQWRSARLEAFRKRYGVDPENASWKQQLDFMLSELNGGDPGGGAVTGANSSQAALSAYVNSFMRPGDGAAGDMRRGQAAMITINRIDINVPNGDPHTIAGGIHGAVATAFQSNTGPR